MNLKEYLEKLEKVNPKEIKDLKDVTGPLQEMFKAMVQEVLKAEISNHLGYEKYERNGSENARNGKTSKTLKTNIGAIEVDVPRDRKAEFEPQLIKKGQTIHEELGEKIISMYAKGMSLRDINAHMQEIYGFDISASQLSDITDKILPLVSEWQSRPLENIYTIVYLDAIHYKVKQDGKIISKAVYICLGIDLNGRKDILGVWVGENESSKFWLSVCNELKNRGVNDILISCIDGLPGLPDAIKIVFPKTEIQLCIVHQIRNSIRYVSWKDQKEFLSDLKAVYRAPDEKSGYGNLEKLDEKWGKKYPIVIKSWKDKWENLSTFFKYPDEIRRVIYTTNPLEGLNRQIRKVTKAKSIFPTDQAVQKMVFLACRDIMKKWTMSIHNWSICISQFSVYFEGRVDLSKISS